MEGEDFNLKSETVRSLFSSDKTDLARELLQVKLSKPIDELDFKELRSLSISVLELDNSIVPNEESDFYSFICREVLNLIKVPRDELLKQLQEAIDDLNMVHNARNRRQEELENVSKDKSVEGKSYKIKLHRHYLKKIKNDEDKLINFLKNDLFLSAYTSSMPLKWPIGSRYPFRLSRLFYLTDNISEIHHKIGFAPITEVDNYSKLYDEDRKKFYRIVRQKYTPKYLIKEIKESIDSNHILISRKSILNKLLKFYLKRDWETFANICPAQIEGLFFQLAVEVGVKAESMKTSSITDKVENVWEKSEILNEYDYEYFAFVFPIVRNKISHGQSLGDDLSDLAYSLLFDLKTLCLFFKSWKLKYNEAIYQQEKIKENETDLYHLVKYIDLLKVKIDPFYNPSYTDSDIKKFLRKEFRFEKIKNRVIPGTILGVTIGSYAKKIRKMSINVEDCNKVIDYYKYKM